MLALAVLTGLLVTVVTQSPPANAVSTAPGDGLLVYGQASNTTPQARTYTNGTNTFGSAGNTVAAATGVSMVTKTSPRKQEAINAYVTSAGVLRVMCFDGTTWTNEWNVTVGGTGTTRRFDVAYETNSGDAMVLYATNNTTNNELNYRTHSGSSGCGSGWSVATNLDPTGTTGVPYYVKLASDRRSSSDQLAAVWSDGNSDATVMTWTGSAWVNEPALLEANVGSVGATPDVDNIDIDFESISGDIMVVWSHSASYNTNGVYWATCVGGNVATCTWTNQGAWNATGDVATTLDLSANPQTDEMVLGTSGYDGATDGDLGMGYWSGTVWTNSVNVDTSAINNVAGTKMVTTGWLVSGNLTRSIVIYADATATTTSISAYSGNQGVFTVMTDFAGAPVPAAFRYFDFQMDPKNLDRGMLTYNDNAATPDLFGKRLVLSAGPTFTWSNSDGSAALEASLAQATNGAFSFAYWRNQADMTQNQYRWYGNTNAVQPTTALAAENTTANVSSSSTIARLRANMTVSDMSLSAGASRFGLQYATSTSGPWADVGPGNWCNTASPLCNTSWLSRKKITFNNSAQTTPLTNFAVAVQLNSSNIDYSKTKAGGADIRFVDSDGTALNYEIEKWTTSGTSVVWVKVPQIDASSNSDYIWIYYNNAAATDAQSKTNVWDSNTVADYHMNTSPASTCSGTKELCDSTSNVNHGDATGMAAGDLQAAKIGDGLNFSSDEINTVDTPSLDVTNFTFSAWIKPSTVTGDYLTLFCRGGTYCFQTNWDSTSSGINDGGGWSNAEFPGSIPNPNIWYHFVAVFDTTANTVTHYINGVQVGSVAETMNIPADSVGLIIGGSGGGEYWAGQVDELRIDNTPRSADWVKAQYMNGSGTFTTVSSEQNNTGAWKYKDNSTPLDGATVTSNLLSASNVAGSYNETGPASSNPNSATIGQNVEYDWALDPASATANTMYYFRIVRDNGTPVNGYTNYPELWYGAAMAQNLYRWYQNTNALQPTTPYAAENTAATGITTSTPVRLRQNVAVSGMNLTSGAAGFKLQYGTSTTGPWTDVNSWCTTTSPLCNTSWLTRKKITIDNSASSTALTNFTVLVQLSAANIDYTKTQNAGQDIRFVDSDGTALNYEIERWDESGTSSVWVKIPQVDATSIQDYFWMYYDNASASDAQSAASAYDANTAMVQHLEETGACALTFTDSKGPNNGSCGGTPTAASSGQVGYGRAFNGTTDYITIPDSVSLSPTSALTFSGWFNQSALGTNRALAGKWQYSSDGGWALQTSNADSSRLRLFVATSAGDTGNNYIDTPVGSWTASSWHHVAWTFDSTGSTNADKFKIYIDGVSQTLTFIGTMPGAIRDAASEMRIGDFYGLNRWWNGSADEVQFDSVARSGDWIKARYLSQSSLYNSFSTASNQASSGWKMYDNSTPTDGTAVSSTLLTGSNIAGRYAESVPTATNPNTTTTGQIMEWDFALDPALVTPSTYYFRMVMSDGSALPTYTVYPQITISPILNQSLYRWYQNADNVQPGTAMAAENTAGSITSSSTVARLREQVAVSGMNLSASGQAFKLQYGTSTSGPWTDTGSPWCATATPLCDANWGSRKKITFDNSASSTNLTNFPVRVSLSASNIDYTKTQNSGQDIRFVDGDGTALNYEIENWNESGTSDVWVNVPQIDATSTTDYIWIYYNNASASDAQNKTSVWDSNYKGVWHLNENPAGGAPQMLDSTATPSNGTTSNMVAGDQATGQVSGSLGFNGSNKSVNFGNNSKLNVSATNLLTIEAWYKRATTTSGGTIVARGTSGSNGYTVDLGVASCTTDQFKVSKYGVVDMCMGTAPSDTNWHHFAVVMSGTGANVYIDGVSNGTNGNTANLISSTSNLVMGNGGAWLNGRLDEVRASNSARSADWVKADYMQGANTMASYGTEEASTGWRFKNNATPVDGTAVTANLLTGTDVAARYIESNPTSTNPNAVNAGQEMEWDYALDPATVASGMYYFRMVKSDGTALDTYTVYPQMNVVAARNQAAYRFYSNANSTDVGAALAAQDTGATAPAQGTPFRLRTAVDISNYAYDNTQPTLKLQYATRSGTCDTAFSGETYADVATGSGAIRFYNNATPADGATATANANDPTYLAHTKVMQSYEEANNTTTVTTVPTGQLGMWDFSLVDFSATAGTSYCFRLVDSSGSILDTYTQIPQITTATSNVAPNAPTNLAQTKTNGDGIPKTTLFNWDAGTQSWNEGNDTGSYETGITRTGTGSYKVSTTDGGTNVTDSIATARDLSANGPTFSVWVYMPAANTGTNWRARFQIQDATDDSYISGTYINLLADNWTLITYTPAPELLANMKRIRVQTTSSGATGTNLIYMDDLQQGNTTWTNETSVRFTATASDTNNPDTLGLCVETKPIASAFDGTGEVCSSPLIAYSGTPVAVEVTKAGLSDGTQYHWRARTIDTGGLYSSYVSYGGNTDTTTASPDFGIDASTATGGTVYDGSNAGVDTAYNDGTLNTLSANWSGFSDTTSGIAYYEYSFGTSAGNTSTSGGWTRTSNTSITRSNLTLQTGQMYYANVRAIDTAGNVQTVVSSNGQLVAPTLSFTLSSSSIAFAGLNSGNSYTDTKTLNLSVSTNGYNGFTTRSYATSLPTGPAGTLSWFNGGTYASPSAWGASTGYGYTSNDTTIGGSNKFSGGTLYAPFTTTSPGDVVADYTTPNVTGSPIFQNTTITHKVTATASSVAGQYSTVIVYGTTVGY